MDFRDGPDGASVRQGIWLSVALAKSAAKIYFAGPDALSMPFNFWLLYRTF